MTEPVITQQINQISQIDTTSDIAGGAAVNPAYIAADVPVTAEVNESASIDSVEVANSASSSQVSLAGTVDQKESSNYIQSDVPADQLIAGILDGNDMNSRDEVMNSLKNINPNDPAVQALLAGLKEQGIITDGMLDDQLVLAVNKYVSGNFSYIAETGGDQWQTVSETIKNGGGDCEDLANLEAGLLTAAFIGRGMSLEEASNRIGAVVVVDVNSGIGHVYVKYTSESGSVKYLNPSNAAVLKSIGAGQKQIFSYSASSVYDVDNNFDYSKLVTAESITSAPANMDLYFNTLSSAELVAAQVNLAIEMMFEAEELAKLYDEYMAKKAAWEAAAAAMSPYEVQFVEYLKSRLSWDKLLRFSQIKWDVNGIDPDTQEDWDLWDELKDWYTSDGVGESTNNRYQLSIDYPDDEVENTDPSYSLLTMPGGYQNVYINIPSPSLDTTTMINNDLDGDGLPGMPADATVPHDPCSDIDPTPYFFVEYGTSTPYANGTVGYTTCMYKYRDKNVGTNGDDIETDALSWLEDNIDSHNDAPIEFFDTDGDFINDTVQVKIYSSIQSYVANNGDGVMDTIAWTHDTDPQHCLYIYKYRDLNDGYEGDNRESTISATCVNPGLIQSTNFLDTDGDHIRDVAVVEYTGYQFCYERGSYTGLLRTLAEKYVPYLEVKYRWDQKWPFWANHFCDPILNPDWVDWLSTNCPNYQDLSLAQQDAQKALYLHHVFQDCFTTDAAGFRHINWDCDLFTDLKERMTHAKGLMMITSLIYEAKRDLRGLVEQQLSEGAEVSYKGMSITRLSEKKINKLERNLQNAVTNLLRACDSFNSNVYQDKVSSINARYDQQEDAISMDVPGSSEVDDRQSRIYEVEQQRLAALNVVNDQLRAIEQENMDHMKSMLSSSKGTAVSGTGYDAYFNAVNTAIDTACTSIQNDSYVSHTDAPADGHSWYSVNNDLVRQGRSGISSAISVLRAFFICKQAKSDMRNLSHQEMTGVGGRQSNTEVASLMNESQSGEALSWFDRAVGAIGSKVRLLNQITKNDNSIDELNEEIVAAHEAEAKQEATLWLRAIVMVIAVICNVIPGIGTLLCFILMAVAMAITYTANLIEAYGNTDLAEDMLNIEQKYSNRDYNPASDTYTARNATVSNKTNDQLYDQNSDLYAIAVAASAQNSAEATMAGMGTNYLVEMADGYLSGGITGSSAIDTVKFANAERSINRANLLMLVAETARRTRAEMRNLAHMEMTGIAGRSPSNMTTYALEAARAQQSFIVNQLFSNIADINQARNMTYERTRSIHLADDYLHAARTARNWSWVPIVGPAVGNDRSNTADLNSQRDQATETANANFTTSERTGDPTLDALITDGMMDTGNGTVAADNPAAATARSGAAQAFILAGVESTLKKTLRDIRSLVHMEMTGIKSMSDSSFADQANVMNFQMAMKSIKYISDYLSQKAQIQNRAHEAQENITKLDQQISNTKNGEYWAIAAAALVAIASIFVPGAYASLSAICNVVSLTTMAADLALSITKAVNSRLDRKYAEKNAIDDMGEVLNYIKLHQTMDDSVNSTKSRLEKLEQQCVDEISENLLQDLGNGYIGVNKGLAAQYKNMMETLYRGERKKTEVAQALRELKNIVHEAMTGISGLSGYNTALSVLNIREENIMGKIDDLFNMLDVEVGRWNQISDAQREVARAKARQTGETISVTIQAVSTAISLYTAFSSSAGETNATNDYKHNKINADQYANKMNSLTSMKNSFAQIQTALSIGGVLSRVAVAMWEKSTRKEEAAQISARPGNSGITSTAKTSTVIARNNIPGDVNLDMAANAEARLGQEQLKYQSMKYALKDHEIDREYKEQINNVWKDVIFSKVPELLGEIKDHLKIKEKLELREKGKIFPTGSAGESKTSGKVTVPTNTTTNDTLKELKEIVATNPNATPQIAATLGRFIESAQNARSSSTSAFNEWINSIEAMVGAKDPTKAEGAQKSEGKEAAKQPTKAQLEQAVREARQKLIKCQQEYVQAMKNLIEAKMALPKAGSQFASAEEELDRQFDQLHLEGTMANNSRLDELDELEKKTNDPKAKKLIKNEKVKLQKEFAKIEKQMDKLEIEKVAIKVGRKESEESVEEAKRDLNQTKANLASAKAECSELTKALNVAMRGGNVSAVASMDKKKQDDENGSVNVVTSMFVRS